LLCGNDVLHEARIILRGQAARRGEDLQLASDLPSLFVHKNFRLNQYRGGIPFAGNIRAYFYRVDGLARSRKIP
jgi:hypothetical protein